MSAGGQSVVVEEHAYGRNMSDEGGRVMMGWCGEDSNYHGEGD